MKFFKIISMVDSWGIDCEIAVRWMYLNFTDEKSTLVQVMTWCRQATSHYLSQCWPSSLWPYGVTRPHFANRNVAAVPNIELTIWNINLNLTLYVGEWNDTCTYLWLTYGDYMCWYTILKEYLFEIVWILIFLFNDYIRIRLSIIFRLLFMFAYRDC